jgi:GTPase SAR1 family protein
LWDTAGTEKFQSVTRSYYKNSNGIVLIFDLTSRKSFNQLKKWVNEINDYCPKESEIILVGNKSDCNYRTIEKEEAQLFAKKNNYDYIETSALNGTNVLLLFETLSKKLVEKENNNESLDNTKTSLFNNRKSLNNYYRSNSLSADKYIQRRNNKNKNITKKKDKSSCC